MQRPYLLPKINRPLAKVLIKSIQDIKLTI